MEFAAYCPMCGLVVGSMKEGGLHAPCITFGILGGRYTDRGTWWQLCLENGRRVMDSLSGNPGK